MRTLLLREKNTILIGREICDATAEMVRDALLGFSLEPTTVIKVLLETPGGAMRPSTLIYDLLNAVPNPTTGIVIGRCHSAALIVLAGCKKKCSLPHGSFLFHNTKSSMLLHGDSGTDAEEELRAYLEDHRLMVEQKKKIHMSGFNMSEEVWNNLNRRGEHFGILVFAEEAKSLGIITEIVTTIP